MAWPIYIIWNDLQVPQLLVEVASKYRKSSFKSLFFSENLWTPPKRCLSFPFFICRKYSGEPHFQGNLFAICVCSYITFIEGARRSEKPQNGSWPTFATQNGLFQIFETINDCRSKLSFCFMLTQEMSIIHDLNMVTW